MNRTRVHAGLVVLLCLFLCACAARKSLVVTGGSIEVLGQALIGLQAVTAEVYATATVEERSWMVGNLRPSLLKAKATWLALKSAWDTWKDLTLSGGDFSQPEEVTKLAKDLQGLLADIRAMLGRMK